MNDNNILTRYEVQILMLDHTNTGADICPACIYFLISLWLASNLLSHSSIEQYSLLTSLHLTCWGNIHKASSTYEKCRIYENISLYAPKNCYCMLLIFFI
jgi:hypothetical protein